MVNYIRSEDEDGYVTQSRRRSKPIESNLFKNSEINGKLRSDVKLRDNHNIKVERKTICASMGKKGRRDVIHLAVWTGNRRRFCWLSFKAGIWLARFLKMEAHGSDGKSINRNFREEEDWMLASREENDFGRCIRLQVSHSKAFPDTLFFPAGKNGIGWWDTGVFLEELMSSVSLGKERNLKDEKAAIPAANVWFNPNRKDHSQISKFDKVSNSIWQRSFVVEIASGHEFEWKEVGKWLMVKFGWSLGFELQPIDDRKAVFSVNTFAEFSRIKNFGSWKIGAVNVKIFPWFMEINVIQKPNPVNMRKQWVGIKGVPYNLWDFSTFKSIGDKFGGLIEVSPESSMATDLSEIRVCVLGPVSNGVWCEELILGKSKIWAEIRLIGEVLEPSRQDMKPVSVSIDRMEPPPGKLWRLKPTLVISNKEDEESKRGDNLMVDQVQRQANPVTTSVGCSPLVGADIRPSQNGTCVQDDLTLKDSNFEKIVAVTAPREPKNGGPSLGCQAQSVSKSSDILSHPPGFGPSSNVSSSIGHGSSLRSLRKQVKSKLSNECCMANSFSSVSLHGNSMDGNGANGSDKEANKEVAFSSSIGEMEKKTNSPIEDSDDAASHTSGSARRINNSSGDAMCVAKGIADKFNALFSKLKGSGHSSGIVFSKQEISFVTSSILSQANAFKDELVMEEIEGS